MKLSEKVKPGEETKTSGVLHPAGRFVFQIQDGVKLKWNETKTSYGYTIPVKSVQALPGTSDEGVGALINWHLNLEYGSGTPNEKRQTQFSAVLVHTNVAGDMLQKYGDDLPTSDQTFADAIGMKLMGKLIGLEIIHKSEQMKDDPTKKIPKADVAAVFPANMKKAAAAPGAQAASDF